MIILAAGYFGVRTSARLGTILGVSEIAVFLVLAMFLLVHAGGHNTARCSPRTTPRPASPG